MEPLALRVLDANKWKLPLFTVFLTSMGLIVPSFFPFCSSLGLTKAHAWSLEGIFALTLAATRIQSGYFADLYGRRSSLILAAAIRVVSSACYLFAESFEALVVAEVLGAIGIGLGLGPDDALLKDSLNATGDGALYSKYNARKRAIWVGSFSVSFALGGVLAYYHLRAPAMAAVIGQTVALLVAISIAEAPRNVRKAEDGHLREIGRIMHEVLARDRLVRWVVLFSATTSAIAQSGFWIYQPYLVDCGVDKIYWGFIFAANNIFSGWIALHAVSLEKRMGRAALCSAIPLAIAGFYLVLGSSVSPWSVVFMAGVGMVRVVSDVTMLEWLQDIIGEDIRATVIGVQQMISGSIYTFVMFGISAIGDSITPASLLASLGIASLFFGVALNQMRRGLGG